jgi:SAM-dependent methyltransferase
LAEYATKESDVSLLRRVEKYLDDRKCKISLPPERVREIIEKNKVGDWFFYAFANRVERWHICEPSLWILSNLPRESEIFETGCGCGLNLVWFAQKGFTHLMGSDISHETILAGEEIVRLANATIELWQDDGLAPTRLPEKIDVLLALNWTYHIDNFDLVDFLKTYSKTLRQNGRIIIDVIDTEYDNIENNQYLTSDWSKPEELRNPTEYKVRYSRAHVVKSARESGYNIQHSISNKQLIPRTVYILQRV